MVKLTIAIPTYNRIHQLKDTVELLLPQLCPDVQINIFDNCSDTPVEYALSELAQSGIKIHRNKVNIGLSGNFIKCFEECESEWIWILSDDDTPKHNSVKVILEYISAHKDLSFINFNSNLCNHSGYTLLDTFNIGQTELISNLMSFSNLLFVSSSVYNISKLKTSLKSAYYFSYTYAPQTALLLDYLRNNPAATTMYSCASIVEWKAPAEGHKWSDDIIDKAVQDLVYTVDDGDARKLLFEKITVYHPYNYISATETLHSFTLSDSTERHDLLADYFTSLAFVSWASRANIAKLLFKISKTSILILLTTIWPFSAYAKRIAKNKINRNNYNKFMYAQSDKRI